LASGYAVAGPGSGLAGNEVGRVQDRQVPLDVFVGRAAELARVAEVVARVEAGQPWLVAIEGDPGMGKTSLARRCLAGGPGLAVLWARAGQAETDLDFGLVGQLLRAAGDVSAPVLAGDGSGSAASSFAAGAYLLEVVGELGANGPVAVVVDDLQWADRRSVEALTFMLRRLSVDPVIALVIYRGSTDRLDDAAQRMLSSVESRLRISLDALDEEEVAAMAAALAEPLEDEAARWLYRHTGGHPLYLRTVLAEGSGFDPRAVERLALPPSLTAAISDQLWALPADTRSVLEMLSVLNLRLPLAQLGQAAQVDSPSAAIEPAVAAGLADWWPEEPSAAPDYGRGIPGPGAAPGGGGGRAVRPARLRAGPDGALVGPVRRGTAAVHQGAGASAERPGQRPAGPR
jgi:AAA ATPase domain